MSRELVSTTQLVDILNLRNTQNYKGSLSREYEELERKIYLQRSRLPNRFCHDCNRRHELHYCENIRCERCGIRGHQRQVCNNKFYYYNRIYQCGCDAAICKRKRSEMRGQFGTHCCVCKESCDMSQMEMNYTTHQMRCMRCKELAGNNKRQITPPESPKPKRTYTPTPEPDELNIDLGESSNQNTQLTYAQIVRTEVEELPIKSNVSKEEEDRQNIQIERSEEYKKGKDGYPTEREIIRLINEDPEDGPRYREKSEMVKGRIIEKWMERILIERGFKQPEEKLETCRTCKKLWERNEMQSRQEGYETSFYCNLECMYASMINQEIIYTQTDLVPDGAQKRIEKITQLAERFCYSTKYKGIDFDMQPKTIIKNYHKNFGRENTQEINEYMDKYCQQIVEEEREKIIEQAKVDLGEDMETLYNPDVGLVALKKRAEFAENAQKNLIEENERLRSQLKELYEKITPKVNNERKIPNKYFNLEGRLDLESMDKISWEDYEKEELIRVIVKNIEKVKVIEQNGKRRERQYQSVMTGYERAIQRINNNEQNTPSKETERVTQLIEQNNELEKQLTQITQNYRNLELNYQYEWILNEQQMLEKVIIQERLTKTQGMLLQTRKTRSEERRVGKECRSKRSTNH